MHTDWFFSIGKAHTICEDYAINGDKCVIVSDGCSSSKHTDLGSRLLTHSARILLNDKSDWWYDEFGDAVITQAAKLLDTLKMGYECLYATLLIAQMLPSGEINVKMYGDGIILVISKGSVETIEVTYTNNMPYYLAYSVDPQSMNAYKKFHNKRTAVHSKNGTIVFDTTTDYYHPIEFNFSPDDAQTVLISTDGLSSFEDSQSRTLVPLSTIAQQVADFKVMKGEFLKRKLNKVLENMAAKKVFPLDDVGIAGIHLEEGDRQCRTAISEERE